MRFAVILLGMSLVWGAYLLGSRFIDTGSRVSTLLRVGLLLLLPLVAALVHGQTLPQKAIWLVPYAFASVALLGFAMFVGRQVSHPVAGLVLGVPALLVAAGLAGLAHLVISRKGW